MAALGALGCHQLAMANAAMATTASPEKINTRRGKVVVTSGLDHERPLHRRVGAAAATNIAVEDELAGPGGRKRGVVRSFGGRNDADPQLVDGPLMLPAAVGVMGDVQARQPNGHPFPDFHADLIQSE